MQVEHKLKLDRDFDKKFKAAIDAIQAQENQVDHGDLVQALLTETRRQIAQAFKLGLRAHTIINGGSS